MAAALAQHSLHPASRALMVAASQESFTQAWQATGVTEYAGQGLSANVQAAGDASPAIALRLGSALSLIHI